MFKPPIGAKKAWNATTSTIDKIDLGEFLVMGSIEGLMAIYLAAFVQYFSKPFTFFSFWVSNLGANNTPYIFNIGLFISSILLGIFVLTLNVKFRRELMKKKAIVITTIIMGGISVVGIILLTNYNMFSGAVLHAIGAYMFFFSSLGIVIFTTYQISNIKSLSRLMKFTLALDILFYVGMGVSILLVSFVVDGNVINTMLSSMAPEFAMVRFFEWMVVTWFMVWLFVAGLEIKRK